MAVRLCAPLTQVFVARNCACARAGFSRTASEIAGAQIKNIPKKKPELKAMYDMVQEAMHEIDNPTTIDEPADEMVIGELLPEEFHKTYFYLLDISRKLFRDFFKGVFSLDILFCYT